MSSTVRQRLLASASVVVACITSYSSDSHASCDPMPSPSFVCSGAETTAQSVAADDAAVTTLPGFSVHTADGNALTITGAGALSFTDANAADLIATGYGSAGLFIVSSGNIIMGNPGSITVNAGGAIAGYRVGILANNQGSGVLSITTGASSVTTVNGSAISAVNFGSDLSVSTGGGGASGPVRGIFARNYGSGVLTIDVGAGGANATGGAGIGIEAKNDGSDLTVITRGGAVGGGSSGILADNLGSGAVQITTGGGAVTGGTAYGVSAHNAGTRLTIDTAGGAVTGGLAGIKAQNDGSGLLAITTGSGAVTGSLTDSIGINALTSGVDLTIAAGGAVSGDLTGIKAENAGSGLLRVTTGAGAVTGTTYSGISAHNQAGASTLTIITGTGAVTGGVNGIYARNEGSGPTSITLGGLVGNALLDPMGQAIVAKDRGAGLTNLASGHIVGLLQLTDESDSLSNTGLWESLGSSDFGLGADSLQNDGTVRVAFSAGVAEASSFLGLEIFFGSGVIDLSDEAAGNGSTTHDSLTLPGDFLGGGSLRMDAFLAGDGNSSADRLVIAGSSSGTTQIALVNTNPGPGELNTTGIELVNVAGSSSAGDFTLAGGALVTGAYIYSLDYAAGSFFLVSHLFASLAELPTLLTAGQTLWSESSTLPSARLEERRGTGQQASGQTQYAALGQEAWVQPAEPGASGFGVWGRALGRWVSRDTSVTVGGSNADASYDQALGGFLVGADVSLEHFVEGTAVFGVMGGWLISRQDFDSGATADYRGPTFGAYASYALGGFYAEGLVKVDLLSLDYAVPGLSGGEDAQLDTYGGRVETGWRFDLGTLFLEPNAALSYAHSDLSDGTIANAEFDGSGDTLRGALGLRIGASFASGGLGIQPTLTLRVDHEFLGDNQARVFGAGVSDSTAEDQAPGTLGVARLELEIFQLEGGWSGYLAADAALGKDYSALGGSAGIRLSF